MGTAASQLLQKVEASWEREHTRGEVMAAAAASSQSPEALLGALAVELAQSYERRLIGHEVAMGKAAALYDAFFLVGPMPPVLYELYWALDEAEYGSEQDGPEENAAEERSRKAVQAVLVKVRTE